MKPQKLVFLIPGFRHKITQNGYRSLRTKLKAEGYTVVPVAIPWKQSTILENTDFFLKKYKEKLEKFAASSKNAYLLGFSYGALIAFLAATKLPVKGLILCSLSPYFKEDLPKKLFAGATVLQEKRFKTFSQLSVAKLTKKIKTKNVCMLYGEKESARLIKRSQSTFSSLLSPNKYLFSIQKTDHAISDKKYINAIHFATSFL